MQFRRDARHRRECIGSTWREVNMKINNLTFLRDFNIVAKTIRIRRLHVMTGTAGNLWRGVKHIACVGGERERWFSIARDKTITGVITSPTTRVKTYSFVRVYHVFITIYYICFLEQYIKYNYNMVYFFNLFFLLNTSTQWYNIISCIRIINSCI